MKNKKRSVTIIVFGFSIALLIIGMLLLINACHGECGSDVHGGMFTFVCTRFYCPKAVSISMTIIGAIGMIVSSCFFVVSAKAKKS